MCPGRETDDNLRSFAGTWFATIEHGVRHRYQGASATPWRRWCAGATGGLETQLLLPTAALRTRGVGHSLHAPVTTVTSGRCEDKGREATPLGGATGPFFARHAVTAGFRSTGHARCGREGRPIQLHSTENYGRVTEAF